MKAFVSPIVEYSGVIDRCRLFIKRDDLIPFSFGGNKYRIASELFKDMSNKGCNCIIGYGNTRSNMCRVIANLASSKGYPCYIVNPILSDDPSEITYNGRIVNLCNAIIRKCPASNVAETIEAVIKECNEAGLKPYYINGDKYGRGNEEAQLRAYSLAYQEIKVQANELGLSFDYIFLPTGTGMTQGGLLAGKIQAKGNERIIGISVARDSNRETEIIYMMLDAFFGHPISRNGEVLVDDSFMCGGYGQYDDCVANTIHSLLINYGLPLDPIYTGKAFAGMVSYIKEHKIEGNILFLHTGGSPLFFDYLKS